MSNKKKYLQMFLILGIICAVSAILIGGVSKMTSKTIENARIAEEKAIIVSMYGDNVTYEKNIVEDDVVQAQYLVYDEDALVGYAYLVSAPNEYGKITIIEAISAEGEIIGVDYLEFSQTPGFGDKINNDDFKGQFLEQVYNGYEIEAVSGATISTRLVDALLKGVSSYHASYLGVEEKKDHKLGLRAVKEMFADDASFSFHAVDDEIIKEQYIVTNDEKVIAYAYLAKKSNEYGEITVIESIDVNGKILGFEYVDFIQTEGFGDKIDNANFTRQFVSQDYDSHQIDVVSGATASLNLVDSLIGEIAKYHKSYLKTANGYRFVRWI